MNRNVNDIAARVPTPHFPRSRFLAHTTRRQTQKHGLLTPFFIAPVYPGDTWDVNTNKFCKMDISAKVPLDNIYEDTYFFFVPYRIIDSDFPKVLGASDSAYDPAAETAHIPQTKVKPDGYSDFPKINSCTSLLSYMNCNIGKIEGSAPFSEFSVTSYPLMAYWKIWNDFFRDEVFDSEVAIDNLKDNETVLNMSDAIIQPGKVNKFSDYFSRAMMTAQRGPEVTIPLGTTAPVYASGDSGIEFEFETAVTESTTVTASGVHGDNNYINAGSDNPLMDIHGLHADLSEATAASINQLRLSFAIQSLYERRAMYGTRYISVLRGQWGLSVPDGLLQRPEYLGGSRQALNNIPVLNTGSSSDQGKPVGSSSTLSGGDKVFKTFLEYGLIIGVSTFRIKHSYGQGRDPMLWDLKDGLDLYNPVFANIGYQAIKNSEIYNDITSTSKNDEVFGYQEAWQRLRTFPDTVAGLFCPLLNGVSSINDLVKLWTYADVYGSLPQLSASWLKEGDSEVDRTLTQKLVPSYSSSGVTIKHEYMCEYSIDIKVTRILPSHSVPVSLIGRL